MVKVRHGVMIIGEASSGKSQIIQTLINAISNLYEF
jgi:hypothetical protein